MLPYLVISLVGWVGWGGWVGWTLQFFVLADLKFFMKVR